MTIGKRVKRARQDRGLTADVVGAAVGLTKQAVYEWEQKDKNPKTVNLAALREVLRVTYAWLMEGGDTPPPAKDDPEVLIEDRMIKLFRRERGSAA